MLDVLQVALKALDSKKAINIVALDISEIASFARHFLVCSGGSSRQIHAIADEVEMRLKENGVRPNHIEGYSNAEWVLMDYLDLVIHIFSQRAREYYDLERLWMDGKTLDVTRLLRAKAPVKSTRKGTRKKRGGTEPGPLE